MLPRKYEEISWWRRLVTCTCCAGMDVYVCKKNVEGKEREMLRENGWLQKFNEGERSKTSVDRTWKY